MNQVIAGKLYDTATATLIAYKSYLLETFELYKKANGELFVMHDVFGGYEQIEPIPAEKAKEFVSSHFNAKVYIVLFGPVEE